MQRRLKFNIANPTVNKKMLYELFVKLTSGSAMNIHNERNMIVTTIPISTIRLNFVRVNIFGLGSKSRANDNVITCMVYGMNVKKIVGSDPDPI